MNGEIEHMSNEDRDLFNNYDPPNWLKEAMAHSQVSPQFRERCSEAASVALSIAKMRRQRSQTQRFVDLSIDAYLSGTAHLAGADLERVLRWVNVSGLTPLTMDNIRGVMRICKEVGISLREALAHVRIGFAEDQGFGPFSLVAAQRGTVDRALEHCEAALADVERGYTGQAQQQIRALEEEVHSAYRELE